MQLSLYLHKIHYINDVVEDVITNTFLMIQITISMTILFSLIFFSFFQSLVKSLYGPLFIRSHISLSMSIIPVRSDHQSQLAQLLSFSQQSLFTFLLRSLAILLFGA